MKTLQVRLPDELREEADSVLNEIGMDMSTAIRVYLKKIVQNRAIPFSLEAGPPLHVEEVAVDGQTQRKMDAVAKTWKRVIK
ncbi:MAG TPA: type II toxin-antitoxin system RelB/DinJ family antitoxin [Oceanipulchritudo sp.]|nr:type II toxin-antitoxin system RelB/DinJ family antitoxin [Oceanipulchritudo sp.]